jgi:hypothetical protein
MGYFYLDDSQHKEPKFILGALIYSENSLETPVREILLKHGFNPQFDEFKSRLAMSDPRNANLRTDINGLLYDCSVGIIISPYISTHDFVMDAIECLSLILKNNVFETTQHEVYFDSGLIIKQKTKLDFKRRSAELNCNFHIEQDSKKIGGIQVADLAANRCSMMLKDVLGIANKFNTYGKNDGFQEDTEVPLGWEFWYHMRARFFKSKYSLDDGATYENTGLFISPKCEPEIIEKSQLRFGGVFLGCEF